MSFWNKLFPVLEDMEPQIGTLSSEAIQESIRVNASRGINEQEIEEMEITVNELYKKLDSVISNNNHIIQKAERLKKLGLTGTPTFISQLTALDDQKREINTRIALTKGKILDLREKFEIQQKYFLKYPGYLFIEQDEMVAIMKKYNLFYAQAGLYSREIPDYVLDEIEKFSSEIEVRKQYLYHNYHKINFYDVENRWEILNSKVKELHDTRRRMNLLYEFDFVNYFIVAPLSHFKEMSVTLYSNDYQNLELVTVNVVKADPESREVKINTTDLKRAEEIRVMKEAKDPIALLPVPGGFIVMKAWDKEAEIPEIQNPISN